MKLSIVVRFFHESRPWRGRTTGLEPATFGLGMAGRALSSARTLDCFASSRQATF
jgi:hypothetical protein